MGSLPSCRPEPRLQHTAAAPAQSRFAGHRGSDAQTRAFADLETQPTSGTAQCHAAGSQVALHGRQIGPYSDHSSHAMQDPGLQCHPSHAALHPAGPAHKVKESVYAPQTLSTPAACPTLVAGAVHRPGSGSAWEHFAGSRLQVLPADETLIQPDPETCTGSHGSQLFWGWNACPNGEICGSAYLLDMGVSFS